MLRKITGFLFVTSLFSSLVFAQIKTNSLDNSQLHKILNDNLSSPWKYQDDGEKIVIQYQKPVWVLSENKINAPVNDESQQEKDERIKKYGQKVTLHIYLTYEKRWTQEEIEQTKRQNQRVYDDLTMLAENLHLTQRDFKTGEFVVKTAQEAESLKTFEKEKSTRLQYVKKIPDYHVGGVSLYYSEDPYFDGSMWSLSSDSEPEKIFKFSQNFKSVLQMAK